MTRTLRELEGEITRIDYGDGLVLDAVYFICPVCNNGHGHLVPYSDASFHELQNPKPRLYEDGGGRVKVWQRTGGSTVDDITLTPSYFVSSCNNFHGYVRNGRWEGC